MVARDKVYCLYQDYQIETNARRHVLMPNLGQELELVYRVGAAASANVVGPLRILKTTPTLSQDGEHRSDPLEGRLAARLRNNGGIASKRAGWRLDFLDALPTGLLKPRSV